MPRTLPTPVRAIFDALVERTALDPVRLRSLVTAHLAEAQEAAARSGLVDIDLANRIGGACLTLLDQWPRLPAPHRQLVQAACLYFAESHDDEDDFASVIGFEDDAEVLDHVAALLGRDDLLIEVE